MTDSNILITQGEFAISDIPGQRISTLLGSCVACCLWDDINHVGGMNHLLLAAQPSQGDQKYDLRGAADMESLINGIIKKGGDRRNLKAKVFGGASMINVTTDIGRANAEFVLSFLEREGIPCINSHVGGKYSRALRFWPTEGRVNMKQNAGDAPPPPAPVAPPPEEGNDLELF